MLLLRQLPVSKLIAAEKYPEALAALSAIIAKDPTNAPAYCLRSYVYGLVKNFSAAHKDINKAVELDPKWPMGYCSRAAFFMEEKRYDDALADIDNAIKIDSRLPEPYMVRAFIHENQGKFAEEIEDCTNAIALEPKMSKAYLVRALAHRQLKQYKEALSDATAAIKLSPRSVKPYIESAYIHKMSGDIKSSIADYTTAIANAATLPRTTETKSTLSEAYVLRAEAYAENKQSAKSIADLTEAVKLAPNALALLRQRGHAYFNTKQYQKALDDYTKVIDNSPHDASQYSWRADTYEQLGQYHKQIDDLSMALSLRPLHSKLVQKRAYAFYRVGMLKEALEDCSLADGLEQNSTDQDYTASYVHEDRGDYTKALDYKTKILDGEKTSAYAWSNRGRIHQLLGNFEQAAKDRYKAHEIATASERAEFQSCSNLLNFKSAEPQHPEQDLREKLAVAPVVLPLHYDGGGHIRLPAKINGKELELMLDTGCGHSDIWQDKLGDIAKPDEITITASMANGKEFKHGIAKVDTLQLGPIELHDVRLSIVDGLPKHQYLSGFLGGNLLEHMVVTINYQKKQVTLSSSAKPYKSETAIVVPIMVRNHLPECMVKINDEIERLALIDTGCPYGMAPHALIKPVLNTPLNFDETITGPWLGEIKSKKVPLMRIALGAKSFDGVIFDVYKEDEAVNAAHQIVLGNDFLSCFKTVTFDYAGRQLILEPAEPGFKSALTLYHEGRFSLSREKYEETIEHFTKSIALEPEMKEDCYYYRAKAYMGLKQYKLALEDLNTLIKNNPKAAWAYYQRARVYDELKDYKREIEDLTTSINLDPEFKFAYANRADAYEKLGQKDLARRDRGMGK